MLHKTVSGKMSIKHRQQRLMVTKCYNQEINFESVYVKTLAISERCLAAKI